MGGIIGRLFREFADHGLGRHLVSMCFPHAERRCERAFYARSGRHGALYRGIERALQALVDSRGAA